MPEPTSTSRGVTTSELWLTVLGVLALVLFVLLDKLDGQWAAVAIGAACFGYQASRAVVKKATVNGEASVANFRADLAALADEGTGDEGAEGPPLRASRPLRAR